MTHFSGSLRTVAILLMVLRITKSLAMYGLTSRPEAQSAPK